MLRVVRQIRQLHGVRVDVEEHGAVGGVFAVLRVAPLLGADGGAVVGAAVLAPDAVGGLVPGGAGVAEEGDEAAAVDAVGDF